MLVLSRREGESIYVGDDVVVHVCRLSGNRVQIGIEAPDDVRIRRSELDLWSKIPDQQQIELMKIGEASRCKLFSSQTIRKKPVAK